MLCKRRIPGGALWWHRTFWGVHQARNGQNSVWLQIDRLPFHSGSGVIHGLRCVCMLATLAPALLFERLHCFLWFPSVAAICDLTLHALHAWLSNVWRLRLSVERALLTCCAACICADYASPCCLLDVGCWRQCLTVCCGREDCLGCCWYCV